MPRDWHDSSRAKPKESRSADREVFELKALSLSTLVKDIAEEIKYLSGLDLRYILNIFYIYSRYQMFAG